MKNEIKYPPIPACQLYENSSIIDCSGNTLATLTDYWKWAHSDLLGNTERGILAEYLVSLALNIKDDRLSWNKYDLLYKQKIRIEVKSSAYIQTWGQKELSKISFSISPSYGWNPEDNSYDDVKKRQSDIYIFCLLNCKDQDQINPTDLSQWQFYVLPTILTDKYNLIAKSSSLSVLKKLPVAQCLFSQLQETVDNTVKTYLNTLAS